MRDRGVKGRATKRGKRERDGKGGIWGDLNNMIASALRNRWSPFIGSRYSGFAPLFSPGTRDSPPGIIIEGFLGFGVEFFVERYGSAQLEGTEVIFDRIVIEACVYGWCLWFFVLD